MVRPIPQSLFTFANTLFGEDAASSTMYRCMYNEVYVCQIGNGFSRPLKKSLASGLAL
jgi:hypothetical protein